VEVEEENEREKQPDDEHRVANKLFCTNRKGFSKEAKVWPLKVMFSLFSNIKS
jgi:hypothetical protein